MLVAFKRIQVNCSARICIDFLDTNYTKNGHELQVLLLGYYTKTTRVVCE